MQAQQNHAQIESILNVLAQNRASCERRIAELETQGVMHTTPIHRGAEREDSQETRRQTDPDAVTPGASPFP